MIPVTITVNGREVAALVEPRTHLGDFLREQCRLTGTHLGCEHGVCGACTVLLDNEPVRSCISFAAACDGQTVRTIEAFDDDPLMERLREALTREHALQCGFCTPGMLISARDIVQRLPRADEQRIRVELAGNLCRCTGYRGIVAAVHSVAETQESFAVTSEPERTPAGSFQAFAASGRSVAVSDRGAVAPRPEAGATPAKGANRFEESFVINRPPAEVWRLFADIPAVAACLPGATLAEHDERSARGSMRVKLGPITAAFAGSASIERQEETMRGMIRGAGQDRPSGSRTRGEVTYRLVPEHTGRATRVYVAVEYTLQGMLGQFARTALVQHLGQRLVGEFAENLNGRFGTGSTAAVGRRATPLNVARVIWDKLRARTRKLIQG